MMEAALASRRRSTGASSVLLELVSLGMRSPYRAVARVALESTALAMARAAPTSAPQGQAAHPVRSVNTPAATAGQARTVSEMAMVVSIARLGHLPHWHPYLAPVVPHVPQANFRLQANHVRIVTPVHTDPIREQYRVPNAHPDTHYHCTYGIGKARMQTYKYSNVAGVRAVLAASVVLVITRIIVPMVAQSARVCVIRTI